jgi:hypothetical protein
MSRSRMVAIHDISFPLFAAPFLVRLRVRHRLTSTRYSDGARMTKWRKNDEVLKPKRNALTRIFRHSAFLILSPFNASPDRLFVLRLSFELCHSSFLDDKHAHLGTSAPRDNGCPIRRRPIQASSRRAVSRNAPRFPALPFLVAMFHPQVPLAEPSLLDRYHFSSCLEINRNHHLRPLAGDNRQ